MSKRLEKISNAIKQELGNIILRDIKDPNLKFVSISNVEVSRDLRIANVYFTTLKKPADIVKESLKKSKGVLKSELVKKIRLKYMPDLIFFEDKGTEYSLEISRVLDELDDGKKD